MNFCYLLATIAVLSSAAASGSKWIAYESFGAVGDGKTDDLSAIVAAHEYANAYGLPVRANPMATYHLGIRALTAVIQTHA